MKKLIDFYGDHCSPCKAMMPIIDQFAKNNPDVAVEKLNIEEHMELARKYNVRSLPTIIFEQDEEIKCSFCGCVDLTTLQNKADEVFE